MANKSIGGQTSPEAALSKSQVRIIKKLATLDKLTYEACRKEQAKKLSLRVGILDGEVEKHRVAHTDSSLLFPTIEPLDCPVDGRELVEKLAAMIRRFTALPAANEYAISLWVLHCWCHDASSISPILLITSPTMRCGKTTLLTLLQGLVPKPLPASNITTAVLFRTVDRFYPTLLVDEADTFLIGKDASKELRGVLNSGHNRSGAYVIRLTGDDHEPKKFSTWAPKAFACIGTPAPTLVDRSIQIQMRRRRPDDKLEKLRLDWIEAELRPLARMCMTWARDNFERVKLCDPAVPEGLNDRAADNWRTLLSVAEVAGCWSLAMDVIAQIPDIEDQPSIGLTLISDVRQILSARQLKTISSVDLVTGLCGLAESRWDSYHQGRPITQSDLSRLLKPYQIKSRTIRFGNITLRGYTVDDFQDAFSRYLASEGETPQQGTHDASLKGYERKT